jgi:VanZ family protein
MVSHVTSPTELRQVPVRLSAAVAALILYGSLFPFEFEPLDFELVAWVLTDWRLWTSRADVVGNIALFVPWGVAASLAARACGRRPHLWAWGGGLALAVLAQALQLFEVHRDPSLSDIVWNLAGTALGTLLVTALRRTGVPAHFGLLIGSVLVAWLPLWPTLDPAAVQAQWHALRWRGGWQLPDGAMMAGLAIAASHAAGRLRPREPQLAAAAACVLLLAGQLLIPGSRLSLPGAAGIATGFALWSVLHATRRDGWLALAAAIAGTQTLGTLAPFDFWHEAQPFYWLPFETMLQGSMRGNAQALARDAWLWGVVLLFADRGGLTARRVGPALAAWVLLLEGVQCYLPSRTADLTPALVVLGVGWLVGRRGMLLELMRLPATPLGSPRCGTRKTP